MSVWIENRTFEGVNIYIYIKFGIKKMLEKSEAAMRKPVQRASNKKNTPQKFLAKKKKMCS